MNVDSTYSMSSFVMSYRACCRLITRSDSLPRGESTPCSTSSAMSSAVSSYRCCGVSRKLPASDRTAETDGTQYVRYRANSSERW